MRTFRFIAQEAAQFPVSLLCRVLGVTRQGYYSWKVRPQSQRSVTDGELKELITQIHDQTLGIYGAPRIHAELRLEHGIFVGQKRVARLMKELGIFGAGRRGRPRTTTRNPARDSAPDRVRRGLPVAEAMACGLPVVIPDRGVCRDFAGPETAVLVPSREVELTGFEVGGLHLSGRPRLIGARASLDMHDHHTWDETARVAAERVATLAGARRPRP